MIAWIETMIEIHNLSKRFAQHTAVDNLSFQVQAGEVLGFLGPNGAGKSTTMKMLSGFLAPSSGRVSIFGCDIQRQTLQAQRQIGSHTGIEHEVEIGRSQPKTSAHRIQGALQP